MKLRQISLDDEGLPSAATVEMTADEMLYVATLLGAQNGAASEKVMPGGSPLNSAVWDCLAGEVFNRYYEDGIGDARRSRRAS